MKLIKAPELEQIGTRLFDAVGSPHDESEIVSEVLVRSSLMGHDSHGVLRFSQYVKDIQSGELKPGAPFEVLRETPASALVEGHQGWGMVIARKAMQLAIEKARQSAVGLVIVRGSQHIGRVGEYPTMAAAENMVGMAIINSYGGSGIVAPWGALEGRLEPNPFAFAIPSGEEWPILVDVTTRPPSTGRRWACCCRWAARWVTRATGSAWSPSCWRAGYRGSDLAGSKTNARGTAFSFKRSTCPPLRRWKSSHRRFKSRLPGSNQPAAPRV